MPSAPSGQHWKKLHSTVLLQHPRMTIVEDDVELPTGATTKYVHLRNAPDAVSVIAVKDNKILIQQEYSYPPDLVMYQLPGGGIEKGESPEEAGMRELKEESGYTGTVSYLGYYYPRNRTSGNKMHVICVSNTTPCKKEGGDAEEFITSAWIPFTKLRHMIAEGEVVNFSILAGLSLYDAKNTIKMTKIIAHRGDTSTFPENTLEAFEAAEKAGVDGIELDVHATSDGRLIVHHDYYLGSPDNGYGIITDIPYSIIKDLTIEGKYYIPKLQDVFDRINDSFHYEIELKCLTLPAAEDVITLSKHYSLLDHIEFTSPHPYLLPRLKEKYPSIITGVFAMPQPEWMDNSLYNKMCINQALLGSFNVLHVQSERITSELVQAAHKEKLLIHAADCNSVKEIKRVTKLGVDQLSTDIVETALRITGGGM